MSMYKAVIGLVLAMFVFTACQTLQGRTAGRYADDSAITAGVKTRLAAGTDAKSLTRVNVDTINGVVHLTGVVESPDTKRQAEDIARRQNGVVRVVNNLQVEGAPAAAPAPPVRR
jgi:hyperosmotically inducible periplasmic protein